MGPPSSKLDPHLLATNRRTSSRNTSSGASAVAPPCRSRHEFGLDTPVGHVEPATPLANAVPPARVRRRSRVPGGDHFFPAPPWPSDRRSSSDGVNGLRPRTVVSLSASGAYDELLVSRLVSEPSPAGEVEVGESFTSTLTSCASYFLLNAHGGGASEDASAVRRIRRAVLAGKRRNAIGCGRSGSGVRQCTNQDPEGALSSSFELLLALSRNQPRLLRRP